MDVFNVKDQVQIMTGNAGFGGAGGLIGFLITAMTQEYGMMISACIFGVCTLLNVLSMKEVPLPELKEQGLAPQLENLGKTLKGYLNAPLCLKKLQMNVFLNWNSLIGLWVYFTHLFALTVSNKESIEEDFEGIYHDFNGTSYDSTESMLNATGFNKSETIAVQHKYLYESGLSRGAMNLNLKYLPQTNSLDHFLYPIGRNLSNILARTNWACNWLKIFAKANNLIG